MADDHPIAYLERIRAYYQGLGYGAPYRWARFDDVPFAALGKPLSECRVGLVTTAAPYREDCGALGPGAPYNGAAKFYQVYAQSSAGRPDVRISHIAYDRVHTTAEDPNTWFPLAQIKRAASEGRIGSVSPRFYGLPTNRSHKTTERVDCPALLSELCDDEVDAAIIVPNCPVCHQSAAFAARHLERNNIPVVVMGCARDLVEHIGVARFLFSDFPLGNSAGPPHDEVGQAQTLALALDLFEQADGPRTIMQSPLKWPGVDGWKRDYSNIELLSDAEIARRRAAFDTQKKAARDRRTSL
jgi:D-proline reductase (dithiol) PrdB